MVLIGMRCGRTLTALPLLERVKLELGLDEQQCAGDHIGVVTEQEAPRAITTASPRPFEHPPRVFRGAGPRCGHRWRTHTPSQSPSARSSTRTSTRRYRDTSTSAPSLRANRFSGLATSVNAVPNTDSRCVRRKRQSSPGGSSGSGTFRGFGALRLKRNPSTRMRKQAAAATNEAVRPLNPIRMLMTARAAPTKAGMA
jgi:hypothetical protein